MAMMFHTIKDWEESCRRYDRNRIGLGFSVNVNQKSYELTGCKQEYATTISELIKTNIQGLIPFLNSVLSLDYVAKEDLVGEEAKLSKTISENIYEWTSVLLNKGFDEFMKIISAQRNILEMSYLLGKIKLIDSEWTLPNTVWNGAEWKNCTKDIWKDVLQSA